MKRYVHKNVGWGHSLVVWHSDLDIPEQRARRSVAKYIPSSPNRFKQQKSNEGFRDWAFRFCAHNTFHAFHTSATSSSYRVVEQQFSQNFFTQERDSWKVFFRQFKLPEKCCGWSSKTSCNATANWGIPSTAEIRDFEWGMTCVWPGESDSDCGEVTFNSPTNFSSRTRKEIKSESLRDIIKLNQARNPFTKCTRSWLAISMSSVLTR